MLIKLPEWKPHRIFSRQLKNGNVNPLAADFLVLDVWKAHVRPDRWGGARRKAAVYYTLGHRRLKCIKEAWSIFSCFALVCFGLLI